MLAVKGQWLLVHCASVYLFLPQPKTLRKVSAACIELQRNKTDTYTQVCVRFGKSGVMLHTSMSAVTAHSNACVRADVLIAPFKLCVPH